MYTEIRSSGQNPPDHSFRVGNQTDGYVVIVDSPHGRIPGKGKCGAAWYPFGGKEYKVHSNFSFLRCSPGHFVTLESYPRGGVPNIQGLVRGYQNDRGVVYSVLCKNTGHGDIPGKGDGNKAWYCWGGREMESNNFQFVVVKPVPAPPPPYYPPQPSFQPGYYPPQPEYAPQPSYPGYVPGGYAPDPAPHHAAAPSFGFSEGMLVRLQCNKTNKNLRIMGCGRVCGFGGTGRFATFRVHVAGSGRYTFTNQDGKVLTKKGFACHASVVLHDPDGVFLVHLNSDDRSVSLESATSPGSYLGIKRDGTPIFKRMRKPSTRFYPQIV